LKKFDLIAALLTFSITAAALAGDCPPPKRLSCERLKELQAQRCPPEEKTVQIIDHYVPAKDCNAVDCKPVDCIAVPCTPVDCNEPEPYTDPVQKLDVKYMVTGGVDLEKGLNPGYNVTGGIFIPLTRTGSLAILAGEHFLKRDEFNTQCFIGCKECDATAPAGSPWRTAINVGWMW